MRKKWTELGVDRVLATPPEESETYVARDVERWEGLMAAGPGSAALAFCRHLTKSDREQMAAAKVAIELCAELGRDSARHVERMANSALMLNPEYKARIANYIGGIGKKDG